MMYGTTEQPDRIILPDKRLLPGHSMDHLVHAA
jgi:hypothetical protein